MIDWLISKLGMLIAIGVVTGFVLALFSWQHGMMVDREGQRLADDVSGIIDSLAGLEAGIRLNMSFEEGKLPATLDGKDYRINVTRNMVIISQGSRMWASNLAGPVICQNISPRQMNLTGFEELETAGHVLVPSGTGFVLERCVLDISGEIKYVTLIYN